MLHPPVRDLTLLTTTHSVPTSTWSTLGQRLQGSVVSSVQRWATRSQRGACRNAMVAGTALAQRRAEREEVEEFLAEREPAAAESEAQPHAQSETQLHAQVDSVPEATRAAARTAHA